MLVGKLVKDPLIFQYYKINIYIILFKLNKHLVCYIIFIMGIPLFFKILSEKYDNCILEELTDINALFIDMNGIIHPCASRAIDENYSHKFKAEYEQRIFVEIENELKKICALTNPEFIYMAVDGVAPVAKMKQQRSRRYKTVLLQKEMDDIHTACNIPINADVWDKNCISPGTEFMNNLSKYLKNVIFNDPYYDKINIILDDSLNPGEGEHKLINFIKKHEFDQSKNIVIHGLDADLIMLSMASHQNNIYLLRDQYEKTIFYDIDTMKLNILQDFKDRYFNGNSNGHINSDRYIDIINDYIFICFFLGNDFLPHILGIDLRYNGLDFVMDHYVQSYNITNSTLTNRSGLNTRVIKVFLSKLSGHIDKQVQFIFNKRRKLRKYFKVIADTDYDNYLEKLNNRPIIKNEEEEYIMNNNHYIKKWPNRYYKIINGEIDRDNIDNMCHNYIEGLLWVYKYYTEGCTNWKWKYEYHNGPLLGDLFKYLYNNVGDINKEFKLPKTKAYHHNVQLLSILPITSLTDDLKMIAKETDINYMYPDEYKLNSIFKRYYWECEPILPNFNIDKVKLAISKKNKKLLKTENSGLIFKNKVIGTYTIT